MRQSIVRWVGAWSVVALAGCTLCAPLAAQAKTKKRVHHVWITVSAIPGADERDFANPVSRCLTSSIKQLHDNAVTQMDKDIKAHGDGHTDAVQLYQTRMDIAWSAMQEPYCGYGAYGMTAVKKSLMKSFEHMRADFLSQVASS